MRQHYNLLYVVGESEYRRVALPQYDTPILYGEDRYLPGERRREDKRELLCITFSPSSISSDAKSGPGEGKSPNMYLSRHYIKNVCIYLMHIIIYILLCIYSCENPIYLSEGNAEGSML